MKTPDEIKKGLGCCGDYKTESCDGCPYEVKECEAKQALCLTYLALDALAYIQQLESRLAQVERERDAAVHDMVKIVHELDGTACEWCKNAYFDEVKCRECRFYNESFEWQGVCPGNSKEDANEQG